MVAILNISRSKVYELLRSGTLPSVHIDRTRLIRHEVSDLGEQIEIALRNRDATIQRTERRAGKLLSRLTRDYGLSMERALERCGGVVSRTEGQRLRRQYEREDRAPMS